MASTVTTPAPVKLGHSRASSNASSQDNESEYSVNLDALPHSTQNDSTFDLSQINRDMIDIVRTDDIDGPTDFTQNLEYWMRLKLPNVVEPTTLEGQGKMDLEQYISSEEALSSTIDAPRTPKDSMSEIVELAKQTDIKGTIERQSTGTLDDDGDEDRTDIHHDHSPTGNSSGSDAGKQAVQSTDLPSLSNSRSPSRRAHSRLQPSVEDHEDSPSQLRVARSVSTVLSGGSHRYRSLGQRTSSDSYLRQRRKSSEEGVGFIKQKQGDQATDPDRQQHDNATSFSPPPSGQSMIELRLREQLEEFKQESRDELKRMIQAHDEELQRQREAREEQDVHNSRRRKELEDLIESEREENKKQTIRYQNLLLKISELEKDLARSHDNYDTLRDGLHISEQTSKKQVLEALQNSEKDLNKMEAEYKERLADLQQKLEAAPSAELVSRATRLESQLKQALQQVSDSNQELAIFQQKLSDRENALNRAQQLTKEAGTRLEGMESAHREIIQHDQEMHDIQISTLEAQVQEAKNESVKTQNNLMVLKGTLEESRTALKRATKRLEEMNDHTHELATKNIESDDKLRSMEERHHVTCEELDASKEQHAQVLLQLKASHTEEIQDLQDKAEKAVLKMRGLLEKERRQNEFLRQQLEQHQESNSSEHEEVENLRNEIRIANDYAEDTERERDQLKTDIEKMDKALEAMLIESRKAKEELKHTKKAMQTLQEDHVLINDLITQKVTEAVQAKEREWKRKVIELKREIEIRSKLLMIEWGRVEVGASEPQPYKYKYLADGLKKT